MNPAFFFFLLLPLLLQQAQANLSLSFCHSTQDPDFCNSVLPGSQVNDIFFYGRFSISRSLSQAQKFSRTVKKHLSKSSLSLSKLALGALQDCDLLSSLNIDFLQSTARTLNSTNSLLDPQEEEVQTLLSALLTNQQTCLEGLQLAASDWSLRNELAPPILNDTKLFSLSLAIFTHAWKKKKNRNADISPKLFPVATRRSRARRFESKGAIEKRLGKITSRLRVVIRSVVVVGKKKDDANFTSIGEAVMSVPDNDDGTGGYHVIYVTAGVYSEYVEVPPRKQFVLMVGDGIKKTVITGNRSVVDGWTTFNSSTFSVLGQGFVAMDMTFRNTAGPTKLQAVAVRNGADRSTFYRCRFEGYQDTLYTHSLRQFYRNCDIYGTIDFAFGNAAAVFQACNFYVRMPLKNQKNVVTAQGRTDPNQNTGTTIQNCKILPTPELVKKGEGIKTYLGRPWEPYSRTVVMESYLDKIIDPAGWFPWKGDLGLDTLFYGEFGNTGPAADTSARVTWPGFRVLTAVDAVNFTVSSFIDGDTWLPATGAPFFSGLT